MGPAPLTSKGFHHLISLPVSIQLKGEHSPSSLRFINSLDMCYRQLSGCTRFHWISFPGGSDGKESACKVRDPDSTPGLGVSPGEGNGYPLQYSCLEKSPRTEEPGGLQSMGFQSWTRLSNTHTHTHTYNSTAMTDNLGAHPAMAGTITTSRVQTPDLQKVLPQEFKCS